MNPDVATDISGASADDYCIPAWYRSRPDNAYFDDTALKDEWQREVYLYARDLMQTKKLLTAYDIGCGSGFKLIKYLGDFDCVGFDLEPTVSFLRANYPDHTWKVADLQATDVPPADLIICSDVIEHVPDPNQIVHFIKRVAAKYAIISTPDRNLVYPPGSPYLGGPPRNLCHVREWTFDEFARYLSRELRIVDHRITNRSQGTQLALCVSKGDVHARVDHESLGSSPHQLGSSLNAGSMLQEQSSSPQDRTAWRNLRRNDPCPCGSGKRYKHCHGSLV
jgi:SAM-dependent methyltransferase